MTSSERPSGLQNLLRAVNHGIGSLGRRGGAAIEPDTSSDEEESDFENLNSGDDDATDNVGDDRQHFSTSGNTRRESHTPNAIIVSSVINFFFCSFFYLLL